MTFFLGMIYKFSLYIFQLFSNFPPILAKKHQFISILTKFSPIYLQDFQIFPFIEKCKDLFFLKNINKFSPFLSKMNKFFTPPPLPTSWRYFTPALKLNLGVTSPKIFIKITTEQWLELNKNSEAMPDLVLKSALPSVSLRWCWPSQVFRNIKYKIIWSKGLFVFLEYCLSPSLFCFHLLLGDESLINVTRLMGNPVGWKLSE